MKGKSSMLQIFPYDKNVSFRKLKHGRNVFHDALKGVLKGEVIFQVLNQDGEDYLLRYIDNHQWSYASEKYEKSKHWAGYSLYPPYIYYDENDTEKLCFDLFDGIRTVWFQEANEYTIVTAGLLLLHTDVNLVFRDSRVTLFYPLSERLIVSDEEPDDSDTSLLRVLNEFYPSVMLMDYHTVDQVLCFHHIFLCQWLTDLPMKNVKYAEIIAAKHEGIGSIMTVYSRYRKFFEKYDLKVTIQSGSSRYQDSMLTRYFNLEITPEDSDETNTIQICNYYSAWFTRMIGNACRAEYNASSLNPEFRAELEEYAEAVLGKKRMLGVLLRGSDFFTSDMSGIAKPVPAKAAIPVIQKYLEEDGYDGIVLATEDIDMLHAMKEAFGKKLIAIAQERYSVADFEEASTIDELERLRRSPKEYVEYVEDTTINYFYAIYLLSRCESLIASNICGGAVLAHVFKEGSFKRDFFLSEMVMKGEACII